ncbi:MAG TPA: galactosyldiacylglycerol synthase [Vicinamibacteria bacterium]|nr:galactosyldiacylglycerol synthase [Vicinamibacteria bacterium]
MIQLYEVETDEPCGRLTDSQFQILVDALEEESAEDQDYYINAETIELLETQGADPELTRVLRTALGGRSEMDVRWERL